MIFIHNILTNALFLDGNFACTRAGCSIVLGKKPTVVVQTESPQIDVQEPIV